MIKLSNCQIFKFGDMKSYSKREQEKIREIGEYDMMGR
jgi:hypothetical protein